MKFRKKPVEVEVFQLKDLSYKTVKEALAFMDQPVTVRRNPEGAREDNGRFDDYMGIVHKDNGLQIKTLEGIVLAREGDWIIKGVEGELYPCKPGIFEKTYEKVDDNA